MLNMVGNRKEDKAQKNRVRILLDMSPTDQTYQKVPQPTKFAIIGLLSPVDLTIPEYLSALDLPHNRHKNHPEV